MAGTHLKDNNLTFALCKEDNNREISDKEKAAVKDDNLPLCVSTNQLTNVLNITAAAIEEHL